jgi:hypothetical protein
MQAAIRDTGPQYALPLVIRLERNAPPARTDALEGAGRARAGLPDGPAGDRGGRERRGAGRRGVKRHAASR